MYAMEGHSAIKKKKLGAFVVMQMGLESVIQSEVSQKEKNKQCLLMHTCGIPWWFRQ